MNKLTGRVAIVTGAATGIGTSIAQSMASEGALVAVNYIGDSKRADEVVARITASGGTAKAIEADVSKPGDVARLFQQTREAFGPVKILVNNAGVFVFGSLESITVEQFHQHFNTNVLGTFLNCQEFVRQSEADGGTIINITSVGVSFSAPNSSLYASTKYAMAGITKNLSMELAPRGIRVNAIAAGFVDTPGTRTAGSVGTDAEAQTVKAIPLGRIGQPDDLGPVAAFLASDDARFIAGDILFVSGGQY